MFLQKPEMHSLLIKKVNLNESQRKNTMSTGESQQQESVAAEQSSAGLLDQITTMMPRAVEKPRRNELIRSLVEESLKGTVKFDKNVGIHRRIFYLVAFEVFSESF